MGKSRVFCVTQGTQKAEANFQPCTEALDIAIRPVHLRRNVEF